MSTQEIIIKLIYLVASVLFIVGIKMLGKTQTARRGNAYSAVGMILAIVATLLQAEVLSYTEIAVTLLASTAVSLWIAGRVQMTQMPEMVALFNGFGGAASMLVAISDYWYRTSQGDTPDITIGTAIVLSILVGAVTLTGSLVAYGKLSGNINGNAIVFKGQHPLNALLFAITIVTGILAVIYPDNLWYLGIVSVISLLLGILTVIPIGGADMPVVISLLNSYSGIAACFTGFILQNEVLIIAGALVGSSGIILTQIMCKGMNRSLINVLLGGFGQTTSGGGGTGKASDIVVKEVGVEEAAMIFDSASSVIIVPGYGMAVAQAQHIVRELTDLLVRKNIDVRFAIHPVAGRMPGHMNVLLAESNIDYDKLVEMEKINDDFANTDVVFVVGANDVVNPAARHDTSSPIYGMPILNADKARTVIVSKRSMNAGYAGIENELFGYPNCLMLFGDAKVSITKLVNELKEME
jgi:NAD(P) transhydrogenase subunit beta